MPAISDDPPGALAISEVARLTGLTTATLRVWQRRYGLGASRSSPGGHRRYSPLDVARLRAVQQLVAQGLPTAEAARVVLGPVEHGFDLPPEADPTAHLLAAAALDLDGPSCRSLLHEHLRDPSGGADLGGRAPSGARSDRVTGGASCPTGSPSSTCSSHIAAATLEATVPTAPPGPPAVMLACVPVEEHELPLVALATALDQRGIPTTLLGAATPTGALVHAIERGRPSVVMLLALLPVLADPACSPRCRRPTSSWPPARAGRAARCPAGWSGSTTCPVPCSSSARPSAPGDQAERTSTFHRPSLRLEGMDTTLTRHLPVATCIGCGARNHERAVRRRLHRPAPGPRRRRRPRRDRHPGRGARRPRRGAT